MSKLTLDQVIIDITMQGADRAALVRHENPGVLVILTSDAAVTRIGPGLIAISASVNAKDPTDAGFNGDASIRITEIFEMTDKFGGFAWFDLFFGNMNVLCAVFTGQPQCDRVAAHCTAHGAPCSLDPKKAAPGYEIIEHRTSQ